MTHKFRYILSLLAFVPAFFTGCKDIGEEDRFIALPAVETEAMVLLEEYTGQKCVNCPDAHDLVNDLLSQYPNNLIVVSIHGGGDAWSFSEETLPGYGLRNNDGQAYCEAYNISSFPSGVIGKSGEVLTSDRWATAIRNELEKPRYIDMSAEALLNSDASFIDVSVAISPNEAYKGTLQVWVVESGIVSLQLTKEGMRTDYVHNHVLRGTVNGHDGEAVELLPHIDRDFSWSIPVASHWNPENLSIVAFFYDKNGVQQVTQTKVVAPAADL